jgi:hypothetical protein
MEFEIQGWSGKGCLSIITDIESQARHYFNTMLGGGHYDRVCMIPKGARYETNQNLYSEQSAPRTNAQRDQK